MNSWLTEQFPDSLNLESGWKCMRGRLLKIYYTPTRPVQALVV